MVFGEDKLIEILLEKLVDEGIKKIAAILNVESDMVALERNVDRIRVVLADLEMTKIETKAIALWHAELREVLYDTEDLMDDFAYAQRRNSKSVKDILLSLTGLSKIQEVLGKSKISSRIRNINSNLSKFVQSYSILQLLESKISSRIPKNFTEEISSTSSSIPNLALQQKKPSMIPGLDKLFEIVLEKLVDEGIKKIAAILNVESDMVALQQNVEEIMRVLVNAESKKIESNSFALWLAELQQVLYDAEDLLDDFAAAILGKSKTGKGAILSFPGFSQMTEAYMKRKISTRIKNINSNLKLNSKVPILQLLASLPNIDEKVSSRIIDTSQFQLDSEIVGIDHDATELIDLITGDSNHEHSVFAITGMGGIGKTTLARKVFHHDRIQNHFDKTVWVYVSSNCSGEYLLKKIVTFIDKNYSESRASLTELSFKLIEVVKEKRVFIVLDDIWKSDVWENFLRVPLYTAAKHSRILITTRKQEVAMKMNAAHTHPMTNMLQSDGWSMLSKIVFNKEEDKGDMNELQKVGKEIVDRCKGLPLAIKVVGGVLRTKNRTIVDWTRVLSRTTWSMQNLPENILPSLGLSYEDLPSHLRRCFIYCSLFPQDFNFHPTKLMYMWIAEGFIHNEGGRRMEESAKEYYNELVMRNILQVTPDSFGNSKCKMHDLLHSLAIFVSQNQYIYVDPKTFGSSGTIRCRHLRLNVENMNVDPKEREYVRTLMLSTNTEIVEIPDELLSGLRRLRVLDLEGIKIERLPEDSVGNMRQLRFLSISASELHMLPDSIENLENLETLMIASVLKSRSLPKGIGKLRKLRHLLVSGRLQNMPNGLDNLKKLRVLDCFVVNECTSSSTSRRRVWRRKKSESNMKELKDLSELTDLSIHNLERVARKEEAQEAAIEKKTNLESLTLGCDLDQRRSTSDEDIKKIEEVFAGIKLPENLKDLRIYGFFGKQLPDHMISDRLRQLTSLKLKNCESLTRLPSLGDLPKLQGLNIDRLRSVVELGSEFLGSLKFPKLQELELWGMQNLERMFDVEEGAFPCLVKLSISSCQKLNSLGEGWNHATCLETLEVARVGNLKSIENLPSLKIMDICRCPALVDVNEVGELDFLGIEDYEMKTLPRWLENITPPKKLLVEGSEELVLGIQESVEAQNIIKKCLHAEVRSRGGSYSYNSNLTGSSGASSSSVTIT